jgi:hypothetical protein
VKIFWHTSCDVSRVARKFQVPGSSKAAADAGLEKLRTATISLAGLRVAPRARKIPPLRRRLPITMLPESRQMVIIRHTGQNLGSVVSEIQPAQSQRV